MTHLPYIAAAYALGVLVPGGLALLAWARLARVRRALRRVDRRRPA